MTSRPGIQGIIFAIYTWHSTPTDGTGIPQSVATIYTKFPSPLLLVTQNSPSYLMPASMQQEFPNKGISNGQENPHLFQSYPTLSSTATSDPKGESLSTIYQS